MKSHEIEELKQHLAETIEVVVKKVVNGKIDNLNLKLDNYIDNDMAWKERAEPLVKAYENTGWLWDIFLKFLKFVVLLGSAIGAYLVIRKYF